MSDVKHLLDEATPLPWTLLRYAHGGGRMFGGAKGDVLIADLYNEADRELIARVMTDLPAYEAAVEALERMADGVERIHDGNPYIGTKDVRDAREALRRLRDEVPV